MVLPEFIFRTVIVRGIRAFRGDSHLLDQLFRNLDRQSAQEMREFFQKQQIYIDINYPRETLKVPAIVILLKSEDEQTTYLGDSMGYGSVPDSLSYDDLSSDDAVVGGAASVSTLSGEGPLKFGPYRVLSATSNTLKIDSRVWAIDQWRVGSHTVQIVGGKGLGQQRGITANGQDTLMVSPGWSAVPDSTSVFTVRGEAQEIVGEPRSLYSRENANFVQRLGAMYGVSYQIQIIGPNPEFTIYLHAIVKSILTIARTFLESQGVITMKLSATDFVPRPDYQPDFTYMRAMTAEFQYPFDVFTQPQDLASGLRVVLEAIASDGGAYILSDTNVA